MYDLCKFSFTVTATSLVWQWESLTVPDSAKNAESEK